ncbi:MAG: hypothetical protein Q9161_006935 [Pseudevernia consocians]
MSAVSPSGVASLRARFEQKDESTSPPSRGRSPAASLSVTGDISRPISKVRTCFVSVEPSGQMGDFKASEELGIKGDVVNNDGAEDSTMDGAVEKPKTNGIESTPQKSTMKEEDIAKQTTPKNSPKKDSTPQKKSGTMNSVLSTANPDKPNSTAEDSTAAILPLDPKEVAAVSGGAALEGEMSPLGSILKGSPFEQDEKKGEASNVRETITTADSTQPPEQQAKGTSTPMANGNPKEAPAQKAGLKSKTKIASHPSAIGKKSFAQPTSSTIQSSENKPRTSTLPAPITPKAATTPSKQPLSKKISPKPAASKDSKKEVPQDAKETTAERSSRPFVAPKAAAATSKPAPKPGKKPGSTSPKSSTKPRPKSPTRSVRLPGSATAPTTASAAKIDAAPAATAKTRDRVPTNPTTLRQKPPRTSLPAGPKPAEKARDKPKSRLSTASSKAPEGSFLDRMMRPTQSSSQKTHEKAEAKSPPNKGNGVRPKRKSDGSEQAKSENVETKGEHSTEPALPPPSPSVKAPAEPVEAPSTDGANNGIDEAPPVSAAPVLSQ